MDEINPPSDPECEQQKEERKEVKGARLRRSAERLRTDGRRDGQTSRQFWLLFLSGQFWINTIRSQSCYRTEGEDRRP